MTTAPATPASPRPAHASRLSRKTASGIRAAVFTCSVVRPATKVSSTQKTPIGSKSATASEIPCGIRPHQGVNL